MSARARSDRIAESAWLAERTDGWVCTWGQYPPDRDETGLAEQMRRRERTGRPVGDESFLTKLSALLGRNLVPKKPGRKPQERK